MLRKSHVILLIATISMFFYCTKNPYTPTVKEPPRQLTGVEKQLVEADNSFGLKIFKEIVQADRTDNVFISPLSISMALGMTLNGANDSTRTAMQTTLEFLGMTEQEINENYQSLIDLLTGLDPRVIFELANSIWYRQGLTIEQEFINLNKTYFNALVTSLDFNDPQAVAIINNWVAQNTHGKIKEIIDGIDPLAMMFLINAIYFKGTWTYEFKKQDTADDWFTRPDGSQVPCKMMQQTNDFMYLETEDFQAIDLPYGDKQFSMTILLPAPDKSVDLLIEQLTVNQMNNWLGSLQKTAGTLHFPKFKLEWEQYLNQVLEKLGMAIAFDPVKADFSRISKDLGLYIGFVKHKTFVQVDEEGTEAAAVTVVGMYTTSIGDPAGFVMRVDRPFLFMIREHHSQSVLFIGKVVDPGAIF